ncbi:MAG TPA: phenylalanine--tRNA ligase subunit beta [Nevskiaceae bacterium]|nr:phenylalanine--tRNA ligase subunit beta [Nevskiaceae bacterium]
MNILIPDSWLKEHLKTKANAKQISYHLSLCSQSVEKTTKIGDDSVYEIEITTNRPDCLSVYGIARELTAILPRFGIKTHLKKLTLKEIPKPVKKLPLKVKINKNNLCPRFTALIFDNITIKPSPKIVRERLEKSGIRALNNVVDISNYLMLELGQPMHTFDYDKIKKAKMILRESVAGEKIVTLDSQKRLLPKGTIIIEDGEKRIIDLCGIMGGQNSEVDQKTKRVLLFVQTYNPAKIRLTCQTLGFRTEAAQRFEKGIDPEGVIPAMKKAVGMFEKLVGAKVANQLIDIYPNPPRPKTITLSETKLNQVMGIKINLSEAKNILESLGFISNPKPQASNLVVTVPHWRQEDVSIPEDLIEEVARIYGYHNLPSMLPKGEIPQSLESESFYWEEQIKKALKFWGFVETVNYSMVSADLLKKTGFDPKKCLKIANPLSEDLVFMRPSLIPSLLEVIAKNLKQKIKIFELANIYLSQGNNKLPEEKLMLAAAITGKKFYHAKGIVEAILEELGIKNKPVGNIAEINGRVTIFELDFGKLTKEATKLKKYQPLPKYPPIIEDLAFVVPEKTPVGELIQLIKSISSIIQSVKLIDSHQQTRTFRITYQSLKKTLNDKEVKKIRDVIIKKVEESFSAHLKTG